MDILPRHLEMVKSILNKYPYTFFVFGSRATGKAKKFSDLDLCYFDSLKAKEILELQDDFYNSNLPYKVDLVGWNRCSDGFKRSIAKDMTPLQTGENYQSTVAQLNKYKELKLNNNKKSN